MMIALPLSINPIELQLLVGIAVVLLVVASFLAVFFSAIIGACVARLLYLAGRYCVNEICHWWPVSAPEPRMNPSGWTTMFAPSTLLTMLRHDIPNRWSSRLSR